MPSHECEDREQRLGDDMAKSKAGSADGEIKRRSKVAPKGSQAPSSEAQTPKGKSIFLFADGTGNSSAKAFKTNVWRMYEAVDLGLASRGKHVQIAYYDNGVGTSSFRPLRLLGGIFGIGLKANVLRLYAFLCRNYQPNDRIYVFGFSRGAFTIRLLVGLITSQGIVQPAGDTALSYQVRDAYRAFCADHWPNRAVARFFAWLLRGIRDGLIHLKRLLMRQCLYRDAERLHTDVEFVGVWDTVAAYGGPFAEFTRGIDDWVWPLSMPHYGLSPKVKKARHALALDDERDAFQPLLWDEYREDLMIKKGATVVVGRADDGSDITEVRKVSPDRLKQVWFTGVHSDVGGGYPDESLSYISLLWMMDELSPDPKAPAVDFIDSFIQRAKDLANPYGPIHDSRSGLGAYYRYQPRKIAALTNPTDVKTLSLRDPEISRGLPEHGPLNCVCVHESVIARIMSGIDNYAPAALPKDLSIVAASGPFSTPVLTAADYAKLASAAPGDALREHHQENAWDLAWRRRLLYFSTVAATLLLVALPLFQALDWIEELCSDDRCFARSMLDKALFFVPQSMRDLLGWWTEKPLLVILMLMVIGGFVAWGKRTERRFRDSVRAVWRSYLAGSLTPKVQPSTLREVRESAPYQRTFNFLKWRLLPAFFGILTLLLLAYALVVVLSQALYAVAEPHNTFCKDRPNDRLAAPGYETRFHLTNTCTDLGFNVEARKPYRIELRVTGTWSDGPDQFLFWPVKDFSADPAQGVHKASLLMRAGSPLKRVTGVNWLKPLTEVRTHEVSGPRQYLKWLIGPDIEIRQADFRWDKDKYVALLCPRRNGHLYLMVNDAAPLLSGLLYRNNGGSAQVKVKAEPSVGKCTPPSD